MIEVRLKKSLQSYPLEVEFHSKSRRIGILGASGSGKSMTLKSVAGIVTPEEGRIVIEEQILFDSTEKINVKVQKRKTGYLFQNYALFPNMTVEKNIMAALSGIPKAEARQKTADLMEQFELKGLEKRYPQELSGGQQQRVALARILSYEPQVILLDEPFSALDGYLKDSLKEEMKRVLAAYPGTMLLVSHDRDEIYEFCDELICMHEGKMIEHGPVKEVFQHPKYRITARLTGCKNLDDAAVIDDQYIHALSWNLRLQTADKLHPDVTSVGIRAHHIVEAQPGDVNAFEYEILSQTESPFEIRYQIRIASTDGAGIWWTVSKLQLQMADNKLPKLLKVAPEHVMLLQE